MDNIVIFQMKQFSRESIGKVDLAPEMFENIIDNLAQATPGSAID
jgi:hypothetical protein